MFHVKLILSGLLDAPLHYLRTHTLASSLKTLLRSITIFLGTESILHNIPHIQSEYEKYSIEYCQSPHNTFMDLNNVRLSKVGCDVQNTCTRDIMV
jgi:hypothetical protein